MGTTDKGLTLTDFFLDGDDNAFMLAQSECAALMREFEASFPKLEEHPFLALQAHDDAAQMSSTRDQAVPAYGDAAQTSAPTPLQSSSKSQVRIKLEQGVSHGEQVVGHKADRGPKYWRIRLRADVKDPVLYGLPTESVRTVARGCVSTSSALLHETAIAQEKAYGIKATLSPTQAMNELDGRARFELYDAGLHAYIVSLWHDGMSIQGNALKASKACYDGAPITLSETSDFIRANSGVTPIWHIMAETNGQLLVTDTPLPACWKGQQLKGKLPARWKGHQLKGKWTTFYVSPTKLGPNDFKPLPLL